MESCLQTGLSDTGLNSPTAATEGRSSPQGRLNERSLFPRNVPLGHEISREEPLGRLLGVSLWEGQKLFIVRLAAVRLGFSEGIGNRWSKGDGRDLRVSLHRVRIRVETPVAQYQRDLPMEVSQAV